MDRARAPNARLLDALLEAGRIPQGAHRRVLEHAGRHGGRVEDALVDLQVLGEAELLRFVATANRTRYVSSEKLARAAIELRVLGRVTSKTAELYGVFPLLFDEATGVLSVATADPDDAAALHDVRLSAGVREVQAIVARPAAIRAAIAKHYRRETGAFAELLGLAPPPALSVDETPRTRPAAEMPALTLDPPLPPPPPAPKLASPSSSNPPERLSSLPLPQERASVPAPAFLLPSVSPAQTETYLETLSVLVSLLEAGRAELRGHSASVARLVRKVCERMGLAPPHIASLVAAAHLHDLGKMGEAHLTALGVAEFEAHRVQASRQLGLPAQLMETAGLPADTTAAMLGMYERFDGKGIPSGLSGQEIPMGARLLAISDAYADLTQNPKNPVGRLLSSAEALMVLGRYRATIFDPNLLDVFEQAVTGEAVSRRLLTARKRALIVDRDVEDSAVLELRLVEAGFEAKNARSALEAELELTKGDTDLVVSEIDLESEGAGFILRETVMAEPYARSLAWVFLTRRADRQTAARAYDLGADDFAAKPVRADVFVAKLQKLLDRRARRSGMRGVSGSLAEMGLPDVVQILWHGRKTCALRIESKVEGSGEIQFDAGLIVHATFGPSSGQDAFFRMLALREGTFRLDPSAVPTARSIDASPEALLLEGMRRVDEGLRPSSG